MRKTFKTERFWLLFADVLFALFLFFYLFYAINMAVIHQGGGAIVSDPAFFQGVETFNKFIFVAGGPIQFLSSFIAQFFHSNLIGSVIVALLGFLMSIELSYIIKKTGFGFKFLRFSAPVVLLCLYLRYTFFFDEQLAMVVTLGLICLYLRFVDTIDVGEALYVLIFIIAAYWLCGGQMLVLALTIGLYDLLIRKSFRDGAFVLLLGWAVPYVISTAILNKDILIAYSNLLGYTPHAHVFEPRSKTLIPLYCLFALPAVFVLGGFLWGKSRRNNKPVSIKFKVAGFAIGHLIVVCSTICFCLFYHDIMMHAVFRSHYYVAERKWTKVVDEVSDYVQSAIDPKFLGYPGNIHIITSTNLALYNLNRMGYDLFHFPQNGRTLFSSIKSRFAYSKRGDIYMDMGLLNMAEHQLLESLEVVGEKPDVYQRLALIYLAKRNPDNAAMYLRRLRKLFFYRDWADSYLNAIKKDPMLEHSSDMKYLRSMMLDDSSNQAYPSFFLEENPTLSIDMIKELLKKKPDNRMAFEYLLSFYMVVNDTERFMESFDKYIGYYSYKVLPPLWQQVIISYYSNKPDRQEKIKKYRINQQQFMVYENFMTLLNQYPNKEAAVWELGKNFGKTYYFYYLYGFAGVK